MVFKFCKFYIKCSLNVCSIKKLIKDKTPVIILIAQGEYAYVRVASKLCDIFSSLRFRFRFLSKQSFEGRDPRREK